MARGSAEDAEAHESLQHLQLQGPSSREAGSLRGRAHSRHSRHARRVRRARRVRQEPNGRVHSRPETSRLGRAELARCKAKPRSLQSGSECRINRHPHATRRRATLSADISGQERGGAESLLNPHNQGQLVPDFSGQRGELSRQAAAGIAPHRRSACGASQLFWVLLWAWIVHGTPKHEMS